MMDRPRHEVLGPEHLAELGAIFDKTWTAFASSANIEDTDERAQLACIVLRLYGLQQMGGEQLTKTALRLMKQSSSEAVRIGISAMDRAGERFVGRSTSAPASLKILGVGGT